MKRTELTRKTPLARRPFKPPTREQVAARRKRAREKAAERKRMKQRSETNSRPWEDVELREEYRKQNRKCKYCWAFGRKARLGTAIDHLWQGQNRRPDLWSNFMQSCGTCHRYKHKHMVEGHIIGLKSKQAKEHIRETTGVGTRCEFDLVEMNDAAGLIVLGWLENKLDSHPLDEFFYELGREILAAV